MNAEVKVLAGNKITCILLKDAEGNDARRDISNIYALKWSMSVADKFPVGVVSYFEEEDRQAHIQIPGASIDVNLGNGWEWHSNTDTRKHVLSYHGTMIGAVQYIEVDASRLLVDGAPVTKISMSFIVLLGDHYVTVEFIDNVPVFRCGTGTHLSGIRRAVINCEEGKINCEATLTIESNA